MYSPPEPPPEPWSLLAGTETTFTGEHIEYHWYSGGLGTLEGAIVVKTDRFGQRWQLLLDRSSYLTVRVAAGMLGVTPMTVTNWVNAGVFPAARRINKATVIPFRDVERAARDRGYDLPFND